MYCLHARGCHLTQQSKSPKATSRVSCGRMNAFGAQGQWRILTIHCRPVKAFGALSCTPYILLAKSLWPSLSYNRCRRTFRSEIWANHLIKCETDKDEGSACLVPLCKTQAVLVLVKPVLLHTQA